MADRKPKGLSLSELIKHTASELRDAKQDSSEDAVMLFDGCEIELAVTVKGEAGAGIRFWLVDASTKVSGEKVSKIKLTFGANPDYRLGHTAHEVPASTRKSAMGKDDLA